MAAERTNPLPRRVAFTRPTILLACEGCCRPLVLRMGRASLQIRGADTSLSVDERGRVILKNACPACGKAYRYVEPDKKVRALARDASKTTADGHALADAVETLAHEQQNERSGMD